MVYLGRAQVITRPHLVIPLDPLRARLGDARPDRRGRLQAQGGKLAGGGVHAARQLFGRTRYDKGLPKVSDAIYRHICV